MRKKATHMLQLYCKTTTAQQQHKTSFSSARLTKGEKPMAFIYTHGHRRILVQHLNIQGSVMWSGRHLLRASLPFSSTKSRRRFARVAVDVPYSSHHPRNVMDIYEGETVARNPTKSNIAVVFVHGGMWFRGDKASQSALSFYDAFARVFKSEQAFEEEEDSSPPSLDSNSSQNILANKETADSMSNVGEALSKAGATAYCLNYRLANQLDDSKHPDQVIDVARGIAHVAQLELKQHGSDARIYIMGHSAGAHLACLALASSQRWLLEAFNEAGLDESRAQLTLAGFIGISGPYNLRRLQMSATSPFTVEPAFGNDPIKIRQASPVHVLLDSEKIHRNAMPLLAHTPVLLLNAENDFHLAQDAKEVLIALDRYGTTKVRRVHEVIAGKNHLNIIQSFGSGINEIFKKDYNLLQEEVKTGTSKKVAPKEDLSWGESIIYYSTSSVTKFPHFVSDYLFGKRKIETACQRVLNFMGLVGNMKCSGKG